MRWFSLLSAWQLFLFIHDLQTCRLASIAEEHSKDVDYLSTHFVCCTCSWICLHSSLRTGHCCTEDAFHGHRHCWRWLCRTYGSRSGCWKRCQCSASRKNFFVGGASNFAEGIFAVESELNRLRSDTLTREEAFKHAREMHMYEVNVPMMRDYIYGSADNVDWFMKHGVKFDVIRMTPWEEATWHVIGEYKGKESRCGACCQFEGSVRQARRDNAHGHAGRKSHYG